LSESAEPADSDATTTPAVDPEEHQRRELARLEAWMHESSREPRDYFPEFWDAYPRKVDRKKALAAWKTAIGDLGADPAQVVEVAARFAKEQWRLGTEQRYIPLPATWLGDERWTDEYEPPRNRGFWEN
jgi:Asp-tRNA(Asn)/Glu-tRNA(Gln) amidotransferase A subunit family amidase